MSTIRRFLPITQAYWTSRVQFSGIEVVGHEARFDPARCPHTRTLHTPGLVMTERAVCRPDLLTDGPAQPRLKPGVAIHVVRDCLAALAALHRDGISHGDIKPSNVMLKRTGAAKLVDIGSAVDVPGVVAPPWATKNARARRRRCELHPWARSSR